MSIRFRWVAHTVIAATIALSTPAASHAQASAPTGRWQGWLGCWTVGSKDMAPDMEGAAPRIVCVTPTAHVDVVDISAVDNGQVVSRERVDASGQAAAIDVKGCKGTQTARWSADNRRVFLKSSVTCEGTPIETSAILALTPAGDWLDVRSVVAGAANGPTVRVARYRDVGLPSTVPAELCGGLVERGRSIQVARKWTGSPVESNAIIEATREMGPGVVEAWVLESEQRFAMDTPALMELADAGVPATVTDAMIAVSDENREYAPSKFYGFTYGYPRYGSGSSSAWDQTTGERYVFPKYADLDPWGYGWGRSAVGAVGAGLTPFGGGPYFRFGYGFGLDVALGYGLGGGFGYLPTYLFYTESSNPRWRMGFYHPPVPVVKNEAPGTEARGRAVTKSADAPDVTKAIVAAAAAAAAKSGNAPAPQKGTPRGMK